MSAVEPIVQSGFLSPLLTDETSDDEAILVADFHYASVRLQRVVTVPKGFRTDYASVPRLPFAYMLFGGTAKKAAVIHDYLYRQSGVSRSDADAVFSEAMAASGQGWWRRVPMYAGLRLFGWTAYQERNPDQLEMDVPEGL